MTGSQLLKTAIQRFAILILFIAATSIFASAAPVSCITQGTRMPTDAYTPGNIPAGFGVTGPPDRDHAPGDPDTDFCKTFYFNVPSVGDPDKSAGPGGIRPGGWGSLILTFDRPIDGASFIFDPFCPDPLPGVVEDPLNPGKPEDPVGTDEAQTFRFNNRAYGFLPTDSNTKAGDQIFSVFAVTVRYDANFDGDPGPGILWGLPEAPLSFWQGKASKQGFGFAGVDGFLPAQDSLSAPEPASIVELALGVCALVLLRRYFNSVRNQRTSQCNP